MKKITKLLAVVLAAMIIGAGAGVKVDAACAQAQGGFKTVCGINQRDCGNLNGNPNEIFNCYGRNCKWDVNDLLRRLLGGKAPCIGCDTDSSCIGCDTDSSCVGCDSDLSCIGCDTDKSKPNKPDSDTCGDKCTDTSKDKSTDTAKDKSSDTQNKPISQPTDEAGYNSSYEDEVIRLVNAERAKYGLSELKKDTKATQAARIRAKEIVAKFSHTRPNGSSCFTAAKEIGATYRTAGENIAYGYSTPKQVVDGWMNSEGHRKNILSSSFTKIGVGCYKSGRVLYWSQFFMG
ncbi:MAG: hypothetical protein K6F76_08265 [Clostridiales bacterium]|nr:hypothetical protein [Clostridiales bacterium]